MKKTILENGFTILTNERPESKSATLSVFIKAGSYYESDYPTGTAHFVEHMLFKGTNTRTSKELNEEMDYIGGIWNAYTDHEVTKYYCMVAKDFWQKGTELLLDVVWNHTFPEEELDKERNVILEEIKSYEDEPQELAFEELFRFIHQHQKERRSIIGTKKSVSSITREHLVGFVHDFYQPDNLVFVATGNVNHEELVSFITSFGFSRNGKTTKKNSPFTISASSNKNKVLSRDIQQTHLAFAVPTVDVKHDDLPVLKVIDSVMGSSSSSRLFNLLREDRGLCYSVFTYNDNHSDNGFFLGYIGTETEDIEDIKNLIINEFEGLKTTPLTDKELTRYKNTIKGSFVLQTEQNTSLNEIQGLSYIFDVPTDLDDMIQETEKVTVEDVLRVANTYFHPDRFFFCEVKPKG